MVYLSEKHGANPSLDQCFYCMKNKGLILFGRLRQSQVKALRESGLMDDKSASENDPEAPRRICMDYVPCHECAELMETGVILISVDEKKSTDQKNPYRSGGWVVVKEETIRRIVSPPELAEDILKRRAAFLPDAVWDALGLPRGDQESATETP